MMDKSFSMILSVGDGEFPLEINPKQDIDDNHPLIDRPMRVTDYAKGALRDYRGKKGSISGVIKKRGRVVGYKVRIDGNNYFAPKKDVFVSRQMLEDIHIQSPKASEIIESLSHYKETHDYYGSSWDGVEKFYYHLAKSTREAHIESPGWYKYKSSSRMDMDGKNWRILVPDDAGYVAINCHSMLHDKVWTLATTVYSTKEIEAKKVKLIKGSSHWDATLRWTLKTAEVLEKSGYDYSQAKKDIQKRLDAVDGLEKEAQDLLGDVVKAFKEVKEEIPRLPPLSVGFSDIRITPDSIGVHEPPTDMQCCSVITIDPCVMGRAKYITQILRHELIHYLLETQCSDQTHSEDFHRIADKIDLPMKYRQ
jgi:hypothetical protein